jgi:hypothetical protein
MDERNCRKHRIALGYPVRHMQGGASPGSRRIKGDNPANECCQDLALKPVTQESALHRIPALNL